MEKIEDGHQVTCEADHATLVGVFFLPRPTDFEVLFAGIRESLERPGGSFRIDVTKVEFMNSSGVAALARLLVHAGGKRQKLLVVVDDSVLWQRKLFAAMENLCENLEIVVERGSEA